MRMNEETELRKALKNGDSKLIKRCCENIYIKYSKLIFHVAFDILENKEDAEDVISETFISFFNKLSELHNLKNAKYYLVNSARYISYRKKQEYEKIVEFNDETYFENVEEALDIDYKKMLKQFSTFLSDEEIEIIVLHIELNMKFREIAKIRNSTVFSISGKYKRAIDKIKTKMKGEIK